MKNSSTKYLPKRLTVGKGMEKAKARVLAKVVMVAKEKVKVLGKVPIQAKAKAIPEKVRAKMAEKANHSSGGKIERKTEKSSAGDSKRGSARTTTAHTPMCAE